MPITSVALELFLVIAGALLYWRAADAAARAAGTRRLLAVTSSLLIVVFGCFVLVLDVSGLAG